MAGKKPVVRTDDESVLNDDFLDLPLENEEENEWLSDAEGSLAVDVYQTKDNVIIKAPIAGVSPDDIDVEVAEDVVTLRGERKDCKETDRQEYYVQECYWGSFSRSVILPSATIAEKAVASLKDGILKSSKKKSKRSKSSRPNLQPGV